jgi:hypothetical protein
MDSYLVTAAHDPNWAASINQRNRHFWKEQCEKTTMLMSDDSVSEVAILLMNADLKLRTATGCASLDYHVGVAEQVRQTVQKSFARRGGKARKCDALSQLIFEIVRDRPSITLPKLVHELRGERGAGIVTKIDSEGDALTGVSMIHYVDDNDKSHSVPLSGLRHRLARAKAQLKGTTKVLPK